MYTLRTLVLEPPWNLQKKGELRFFGARQFYKDPKTTKVKKGPLGDLIRESSTLNPEPYMNPRIGFRV